MHLFGFRIIFKKAVKQLQAEDLLDYGNINCMSVEKF